MNSGSKERKCGRCHGAAPMALDVCPYCQHDLRAWHARALSSFWTMAAFAGLIAVAVVPLYIFGLPGRSSSVSTPPVVLAESLNVRTSRPGQINDDTSQQLSKEICGFLQGWVDSFRARRLEEHMQHYGPLLSRYFTWQDVPNPAIRKDKKNFFDTYTDIAKINIRDLQLNMHGRDLAEVQFLKDWEARGRGEFSGTVKQRLLLARSDGQWHITSEEELRTIRRKKTKSSRS